MNNSEWRDVFKTAVDQHDSVEFNKRYIEYLSKFDSFADAVSTNPVGLDVVNAIFGKHAFFLNQTNDVQGEALIEKGRAANRMFEQLSVEERLDFLKVLKSKIDKYQDDIILTITADTGKPIDLSKGEMAKGGEWFQFAQDKAVDQLGDKTEGKGRRSTRGKGVSQVIGAYNYPYALAIGGIVSSLAAGNGVIVSAPMKAPNWVFPFMQAAEEAISEFSATAKKENKPWAEDFAAISKGLIQSSIGVNEPLTESVDLVHFVGSDTVGKKIAKDRGLQPTILEMGGSNVVTVMASAVTSPDKAEEIAKTIYGGFGPATGQRCTAPRMLLIQEGAEAVAEKLKDICRDGPTPHKDIGNPFKEGIKIGPLVDRGAHQKMKEAIATAKRLGATVSGQIEVSENVMPQARGGESYWVNPIVIDWSNVDMTNPQNAKEVHDCLKDEIFGPLLHIIHPVKTLDDAIKMTNKLDSHGLAGAIFTANDDDEIKYKRGTRMVSLARNGAPKDQSPKLEHGHPNRLKIGGPGNFMLYADAYHSTDMAPAPSR